MSFDASSNRWVAASPSGVTLTSITSGADYLPTSGDNWVLSTDNRRYELLTECHNLVPSLAPSAAPSTTIPSSTPISTPSSKPSSEEPTHQPTFSSPTRAPKF